MLVYLRKVAGAPGRKAEFSPASAETGQKIFALKGCAACHRGPHALEARPTRYSLTDFAAAMWNHPFRIAHNPPELSYEEMRRLMGFLVSTQFFEERGDLERGKRVFAAKRCGVCHDDPSSGAPARSALAGRMTSFDMVAALWKHGPAMLDRMRQQRLAWPRFAGTEMADLTAYLHGAELKQRSAGDAHRSGVQLVAVVAGGGDGQPAQHVVGRLAGDLVAGCRALDDFLPDLDADAPSPLLRIQATAARSALIILPSRTEGFFPIRDSANRARRQPR